MREKTMAEKFVDILVEKEKAAIEAAIRAKREDDLKIAAEVTKVIFFLQEKLDTKEDIWGNNQNFFYRHTPARFAKVVAEKVQAATSLVCTSDADNPGIWIAKPSYILPT